MPFPISLRDDQFGERSADRFFPGPAEKSRRLRIPVDELSLDIHPDDGIERIFQNGPDPLLALNQRGARLL